MTTEPKPALPERKSCFPGYSDDQMHAFRAEGVATERAAREAAQQQAEALRKALAELVACDKMTRDYIMTGSMPKNYAERFEAAWRAALAALPQEGV